LLNVLQWNWKNLNSFTYTLCSVVLKLNKWKHLLFMTVLKSPDSLTHPVDLNIMKAASSVGIHFQKP
jgi:hypothetical protein